MARGFKYPTANLEIDWTSLGWETGVYAGRARLAGVAYGAAVVIQKNLPKLEVHLLGYTGEDFYGKEVEVECICKVSEMEPLAGPELLDKIEEDMIKIKKFLSNSPNI